MYTDSVQKHTPFDLPAYQVYPRKLYLPNSFINNWSLPPSKYDLLRMSTSSEEDYYDDDNSDRRMSFTYNGADKVPEYVTHVIVEPTVTIIPERAFQYQSELIEIELPKGLITIEACAFADCKRLRLANIPSTVVEIGPWAFDGCFKLDGIILSEGLQRLGDNAFAGCNSLKTIKIPSTIHTIEEDVFYACRKLKNVVLPEDLREIDEGAFRQCNALSIINLPSSLRVIGYKSFEGCLNLKGISMSDSIETVGGIAFKGASLSNFRIPPLITNVDMGIFQENFPLVSIELSENITECVDLHVVLFCCFVCTQNIALPLGCDINMDRLESYLELFADFNRRHSDLLDGIMAAFPEKDVHYYIDILQHRFDDLPIHKICYYQSYYDNETTMKSIKQEIESLKTLGKQRDCFGMTPLHILACSTKQNVDMFRLLIDEYPEALIMKDRWNGIPLLYAFWCSAPTEVLDLLVDSYKTLHPEYKFDWKGMLLVLIGRDVRLPNIKKLVSTQHNSFPEQKYDMQGIVLEMVAHDTKTKRYTPLIFFRYLLRMSITKRLDALGVNRFREDLEDRIDEVRIEGGREEDTYALYDKLATYELAKETSSILELALWKQMMDESPALIGQRQQYRMSCGADIVVRNVMLYLYKV